MTSPWCFVVYCSESPRFVVPDYFANAPPVAQKDAYVVIGVVMPPHAHAGRRVVARVVQPGDRLEMYPQRGSHGKGFSLYVRRA